MIPISASCLVRGTRKFLDFVGKEKLCHIACWRESMYRWLHGSHFCSIVLEGKFGTLVAPFYFILFIFFNIIYYILFWFFKNLLWTYLLCSSCSVGCGHSTRNLLTVAWWISVYPYCPEDSTTFLYVQVTFHEHDQLYNPLRSSSATDVQMELSPLWYSRVKQTTMPLQMDIW